MSGIIESNPGIFGGKPIVKGTRIPVKLVFELFSMEMPFEEIIEDYPSLTIEMLKQLLMVANSAKLNLDKIDLNHRKINTQEEGYPLVTWIPGKNIGPYKNHK